MRAREFNQEKNTKETFKRMLTDFLLLASKFLKLESLPTFKFQDHITPHDQPSFGMYVNDEDTLYIALANRHPVDILRTIAHELVHYKQDQMNMLNHDSGDTGSPEENQANAMAGVIMRHFNKQHPEYLEMYPVLAETIRKVGSQYRLVSKSGKNLGTYPSRAGAVKREKQVNYFKYKDSTEEGILHRAAGYVGQKLSKYAGAKKLRPGDYIVRPLDTSYKGIPIAFTIDDAGRIFVHGAYDFTRNIEEIHDYIKSQIAVGQVEPMPSRMQRQYTKSQIPQPPVTPPPVAKPDLSKFQYPNAPTLKLKEQGVAEGYKEPTDAAGHAKMAAKIKRMLDDTLADRGDRHGNPDPERLTRAYEYHMKKAKEKSQGVAEGLDWKGTHSGTAQAAETDHTFDDAIEYIKSNYPTVKKYMVRRAEYGFRVYKKGDLNQWDEKELNKSDAHMQGIDGAVDYLQLKKNDMMSGSKQISLSFGYSWMVYENRATGIGILYYQDRGMGQDEIYIGGKDATKHKQARQVFRDAGVLPTPKVKEQGVAEDSLEEIDRRGFLRGMGAAAATAASPGMAQTIPDWQKKANIALQKGPAQKWPGYDEDDNKWPAAKNAPPGSLVAYRGDTRTGKLETLPILIRKEIVSQFLNAYKLCRDNKLLPSISPETWAALLLVEGRSDFGYNGPDILKKYNVTPEKQPNVTNVNYTANQNNASDKFGPKMNVSINMNPIRQGLKNLGISENDWRADFCELLSLKIDTAKRLQIPFYQAWNGGTQFLNRYKLQLQAIQNPKNKPLMNFIRGILGGGQGVEEGKIDEFAPPKDNGDSGNNWPYWLQQADASLQKLGFAKLKFMQDVGYVTKWQSPKESREYIDVVLVPFKQEPNKSESGVIKIQVTVVENNNIKQNNPVIKGIQPDDKTLKLMIFILSSIIESRLNPDSDEQGVAENFADGKNPGRKGLSKRMGVPTKASVSKLRKIAKSSSGEKARMAHWLANMKSGRKK